MSSDYTQVQTAKQKHISLSLEEIAGGGGEEKGEKTDFVKCMSINTIERRTRYCTHYLTEEKRIVS